MKQRDDNVEAKWIGASEPVDQRMPIFRRAFEVQDAPTRAEIELCGLGQHELRVNGRVVDTGVFGPEWTDYRKSCATVRADITGLLRAGENVLGVMLGNGMYRVRGGGKRYTKFKGSFGEPCLWAKLTITHRDGSTQTVASDTRWRWTPGPITFSCIYGGEDHDARLDPIGWDSPGFDDAAWRDAQIAPGPGGRLRPALAPPVRVLERIEAKHVADIGPDRRVLDLGRNIAGRPTIEIEAPAGTEVRILTAELLGEQGAVHQKPIGSPTFSTFTSAGGRAAWTPRFSYTGFRYIQIEGAIESVTRVGAEVIGSSSAVVGRFACSSESINRIHALVIAAMRSNLQSVMTDCPHREKLGWTEQMYLLAPSLLMNFDLRGLYAKSMQDMAEAQRADGCVPTICPQYTQFKPPWDVFNDSPEWGSAIVQVPWEVFRHTGDATLVREHYVRMAAWVGYLASRADADGIIRYGLGDWYDIGPGDPGFGKLTTLGLTATATQCLNLKVMSACAKLVGRADDAARYAQQFEQARRAFNAAFFDASQGVYDNGSQCAQAMPLAIGLVEPGHARSVLDQLVADIRARENHISAGDVGFRYVLEALAQAGRSDIIAELLARRDPPSYAAQIERGATTLTEAWDANPRSSQNHMMLGHIVQWLHGWLAGIQIDFTRAEAPITFRPTPVDGIAFSIAEVALPDGMVVCRWERRDKTMVIRLATPLPARLVTPRGDVSTFALGEHEVVVSID